MGDDILDVRDLEPGAVATWLGQTTVLREDKEPLQCDRNDPLFPVRLRLAAEGLGSVGWLLLGPRPDQSFYGREERDALRNISGPVAKALAIAIEREQREAVQRERDARLQDQIDAISRYLANEFGFGKSSLALRPEGEHGE